jgi:hypothetical protein
VFVIALLSLLCVASLRQFRLEEPEIAATTAERSVPESEPEVRELQDTASFDLQFTSVEDAIRGLDSPYRDSRLAAVYDLSRRAMSAREALPALRRLRTMESDEDLVGAIKEAIYNIRGANNSLNEF